MSRRSRDAESRLDAEIEQHLSSLVDDYSARGLSPEEARAAARRKFGNVTLVKEDARALWTWGWLARLKQDVHVSLRMLRQNPGFTLAAIATLALGIGPNAAIVSVVRGVLIRPLVNRDEGHLVYIRQSAGSANATFSIAEINDLRSRVRGLSAFGDFSSLSFTLLGLGEPRTVRSGVVGGSYFQVMGLRPALGRLLDAADDDPNAAGAVVLTYRFWASALNRDPLVIGKAVQLGSFLGFRSAIVVGVLEPSVPYPQETEIIANVVTSPHHLSAAMTTTRTHRMTELFARLAPGQNLSSARAELQTAYAAMKQQHPEAYPSDADFQISATGLRDQLTSGARTVLLVLLTASALVFVIACANVANLFLARNVRREPEFAVRSALGARSSDLRRLLLADSLLLCGFGLMGALLIADPMVTVLARYASRYSVRALDLRLDWSVVWAGAGLALVAAALLAFVPRLPSSRSHAASLAAATSRTTASVNRTLKLFTLIQIAACFLLVVAAATAGNTLLWLESVQPTFDTRHVLAVDIPLIRNGRGPAQIVALYDEVLRRVGQLSEVVSAAVTTSVPLRDRSTRLQFMGDGSASASTSGHHAPEAAFEVVSPGFFHTLGMPVIAGRDFSDHDRAGGEPVAIVSETLARTMFRNSDALNHHVTWTDDMMHFGPPQPRLIVGVVPDIDDNHVRPVPTMTIYEPAAQEPNLLAQRLVVETRSDPYAVVEPVRRVIQALAANQPVERASTLDDIRAEVLSPERLNALISGLFAAVALAIAIVGVGAVLAFSVSGRTREFGIRLAMGSQPRGLLVRVVTEGASMMAAGLGLGLACGVGLTRVAGSFVGDLKSPGVTPLVLSAVVLLLSAVIAAVMPAARAARVDVMQALRAE